MSEENQKIIEKERKSVKRKESTSTKLLQSVNISFPNGDRYDGEILDNVPHGQGAYYWYNAGVTYKGDWRRGIREGKGKIDFPNNEFYDGTFRNNAFNGFGTYFFQNGNKYVGEWKNGIEDGKGVFYFSSGEKYEGRFQNGVYLGNSKDYFSEADENNKLDESKNYEMVFSTVENKYVPVIKANYVSDF